MKFGIAIPNCHGDYADIHLVTQVAHEAEEAGWDGFFLWDHIGDKWGDEVGDPWVMLAAMAMRTQQIKLGTMVTPVTRRRPWKLAREVATLDHLSNGRIILGVGSGGGIEYVNYHEAADSKTYGERLDEALEILTLLWSGEHISYEGQYYQLDNVRHLPRPVQLPHVPIWVGGVWPNKKPMRRAARWDGVVPIGKALSFTQQMTPEQVGECFRYVRSQQSEERQAQPYATVQWGQLEGKDRGYDAALVSAYEEVGTNWWIENITWERGSLQEIRAFIQQGPPIR
ncbi:LLM class flavin-dependent oxidoreductase [Dictyobacter arantiisoli]|uniref:Luciferase-like protein n=1 Tax=Dictyobacter arantiisoli TaxID=2014874 RepID=A0A5A5TCW0_9CHLR|nr:LLM class flavin-dependent oxidoreductase [Dictyobacter arantiisoli]GCF09035.1 luciferase-like protein [Dictyobacter arantiisoli]